MKNKKYIGQVLSCLAIGMLIPIFIMLIMKFNLKRITVSSHSGYYLTFFWVVSYILEVTFNLFCEKYNKVIWLCCQIISYFLFWGAIDQDRKSVV